MTIDEFNEYAQSHDYVVFTKQQYEHVVDIMNGYDLLQLDYLCRLKADTTEKFKDLRDKLSKWMYHNSESVCGCSMIDIDYLEGHMDELLYELGIYDEFVLKAEVEPQESEE